jgi:SOS-response transcriptional repressor LexA
MGHFPVLSHLWGPGRYVLRVLGESMYPTFQDGDLVLIQYMESPSPETLRGKACVCLIAGETTLKRVDVVNDRGQRRVVLRGDNASSRQILVRDQAELRIQGRVLAIVERMS